MLQVTTIRKIPIRNQKSCLTGYDKPEIAVAVVVEHGEHGGGTAAPVAGQVLRKYFEAKGVIKHLESDSDKEDEVVEEDAGGEN